MKRLSHLIFLACLMNATTGYSQTGQYLNSEFYSNLIPNSPSSSMLGKFGNVPINYYTGLPEISFELLRLKGREIEVPVSISYDASGVKTDEFSGEAGIKWTISAGGYVVRDLKGLPDEHTVEGYWKYSKQTDYYANLDYPAWVNWIEKNERDGSPDEFTIVIPGRSIKFVFNKEKGVVAIPRQNVRIKHTMLNNRINGFELSTEDGTRYLFGGSGETVATRRVESLNIRFKYDFKNAKSATNFQSDMYQLGTETLSKEADLQENSIDLYTSRWYLKSIVSPAGETMKFVYQNTGDVKYVTRPSALRLVPAMVSLEGFTYDERRCVRAGIFGCDEYQDFTYGPFSQVAAVMKFQRTNPGQTCFTSATCGSPVGHFGPKEHHATPGHLNSYHTLITESDIRLLRIESATGSKIVFTTSPRIDLPGTVKVDKISLHDLNGTLVNSYKLNYTEVAADESKDYLWPGEGLIMFHVGTVTEPETSFNGTHIRRYFSNRISNDQLVKYVYEGLKDYNYKRFFLESVDQISKSARDTIRLYKFDYRDANLLTRRTTTLHERFGYQRLNTADVSGWTFQSGKKAMISYGYGFDLNSNAARLSGILTRITYPSGGYTNFIYEPSGENPRLQLVQDFDENNKIATQKEMEYLSFAENIAPVNLCVHDFNIWDTSDWMKYIVTSSSPLNDYSPTHNVARGNKTVRVYYGTKNTNSGFEEFTFTSPVDPGYRDIHPPIFSHPVEQNAAGQDLPSVTNIYPFPKSRDRDYIRGMPLSHKVFASGKTTPLKETVYTYEVNPYGYVPETVIGLKGGSFNYASHSKVTFWYGHEPEVEKRSRYSRYVHQSEWVVLKKTQTTTYDASVSDINRNFAVCTEYEYDTTHMQRIETRTYHRDNPDEKQISRTKYVTHVDYNSPAPTIDCQQQLTNCLASCDALSDPEQRNTCNGNCYNQYYNSCTDANKLQSIAIQHLRNKRQINTPVEIQSLVTKNGQTKLVKSVLYKYQKQGYNEGFSKVSEIHDLTQPIDINTYAASKILPDGTFTSDARLRLAHAYNSYDPATAIVQKQTSRDGTVSSYQWGLNNSVVTGYVVNPGGAQQQQYSYDHISSVGLRSTTDPNGRSSHFEYDDFNRLRLTLDHDKNILSRYRYHYRGQHEGLTNGLITTSCALANTPISLWSTESAPGQTIYQWDFGDGTPVITTTNLQVSHTWLQKGDYVVKVRKENPEYFSKEAIQLISIYSTIAPMNLNITGPTSYDICSLDQPQPTRISTTITGDALTYIWEYKIDNGSWIQYNSGTGPVVRPFTAPPPVFGTGSVVGVFTIRFTAFDACGNTRSAETTLSQYASSPICKQQ
jgi:hypothetical protein